jgi:hypothetical protein
MIYKARAEADEERWRLKSSCWVAVSLTALVVCVLAWVINAIGWVQCVSAV